MEITSNLGGVLLGLTGLGEFAQLRAYEPELGSRLIKTMFCFFERPQPSMTVAKWRHWPGILSGAHTTIIGGCGFLCALSERAKEKPRCLQVL